MSPLLFAFPDQEQLLAGLLETGRYQEGRMTLRRFPDGEHYIRVLDDVAGRDVAILCQLHQPDGKFLPLLLLAATLRDLGAVSVGLIAPYLAYMRQDKRFSEGEGITSHYFAELLSGSMDWLLTVDPHLHRIHRLDEIYRIPAVSLTAVTAMAQWIREHVERPLVIGPDSESRQWAERVATEADCPWEILEKQRLGDREVIVSAPDVGTYGEHTPVLVDDIISTGRTLLQVASQLRDAGLKPPVCVAVHGVFAPGALEEMRRAGLRVVTSNSIECSSSGIDLASLIAEAVNKPG